MIVFRLSHPCASSIRWSTSGAGLKGMPSLPCSWSKKAVIPKNSVARRMPAPFFGGRNREPVPVLTQHGQRFTHTGEEDRGIQCARRIVFRIQGDRLRNASVLMIRKQASEGVVQGFPDQRVEVFFPVGMDTKLPESPELCTGDVPP